MLVGYKIYVVIISPDIHCMYSEIFRNHNHRVRIYAYLLLSKFQKV